MPEIAAITSIRSAAAILRRSWLAGLFVGLAVPAHALEPIIFGVTGGDAGLRDSLIDASLLVGARRSETRDPQEILAAARSDYARFIGVLYERGHFGPVVSILVDGREAALISPLEVPPQIDRVDIRISAGPIYRLGEASVAPLPRGTELPENFVSGAIARTQVIALAGRTAIRSWREVGFAKADISEQRIVADHSVRQVDATLEVAAGPRVRFGTLEVSGNRDVRTERIREIAGLPEGEIFSPFAVADVAENLRRTGTFRSVVLTEADTVAPDGTMDMNLVVSESLPRRFGFGAEFSSRDGLELSAFWLHRNLLGGAERLELDATVTGLSTSDRDVGVTFGGRYTRPATPRPDTDFFIDGRLSQLEERDYSGPLLEFGFGFQRRVTERLTAEIGAGFQLAQIRDAFGLSDYALAVAPARVTYDGRDDFLDPTNGYFIDASVTPFLGLNDTASGARIRADARLYRGIDANDRFVLAGQLQLGSVIGPALSETPNYFLFYSGGGGTVRGRAYQSLGVDLGGGLRTGGRSFLAASAELRARVRDNIEVVGFYDWGYVGAESFPDGSGDSHAGAGFGVRYITPIGPLRIDIGTPVGDPPSNDKLLLYIGIGQAF